VANSLATESPAASQNIHFYLTRLKYIEISLTGDDLMRLGVAPGPRIRDIMDMLHKATLDGHITSRQDEEELVKKWLASHPTLPA